ncbi:MAG: hypothetical protein K2W96_24280, partial [Gemmataceae bacterium]|nr:hypothetical protein [Gemmataceae bacterium]
ADGGHSFPYLPAPKAPLADAPARSFGVPLAYGAGLALIGLALACVVGLRAAYARPAADQRAEARPESSSPESPPAERPVLKQRHPADEEPGGEPVSLPDPPKPESSLPPELQDKVNAAIEKGVADLKRQQKADGSWGDFGHPVAHAALAGLTLLECGVPADDPGIKKAAKLVRDGMDDAAAGQFTYTASLMLLFLDRLGDSKDAPFIRILALRLVAGQNPDGGWAYNIPKLTGSEEERLFVALASNRPKGLDKIVMRPGAGGGPGKIIGGSGGDLEKITGGKEPTPEEAAKAIEALPENLRQLPAFMDELPAGGTRRVRRGKRWIEVPVRFGQISDNSNTQFGALAMWAALRHGIPMEKALQRLGERFRKSQKHDGNWDYRPGMHTTESMTGVGLLGLAISTGLASDRKPARDAAIEKGLAALGKHIHVNGRDSRPFNLYFWWTVERVAMLYGVKEIGGKDWYRGAVELLLGQQRPEGWWGMGGYHGANRTLDTCFALLILKRVNLAPELTKTLEFGLVLPK